MSSPQSFVSAHVHHRGQCFCHHRMFVFAFGVPFVAYGRPGVAEQQRSLCVAMFPLFTQMISGLFDVNLSLLWKVMAFVVGFVRKHMLASVTFR